jgi:hypothetical protein
MSVRDVLVAIFVALIITLVIQAVVLNIKIINLENQDVRAALDLTPVTVPFNIDEE